MIRSPPSATRLNNLVPDPTPFVSVGLIGNVTINLPFVSVDVSPKDRERSVARDVVIRLRDRRVLCAWECCDSCIDQALASLQEIRRTIVDKDRKSTRLNSSH